MSETTKVIEKTIEVASQNSDAIQNKVVSMLDALQNGAVEVGTQVVKYTPDVIDAGLWVIRIEGIQALVFSLSFLLPLWLLHPFAKRSLAWAQAATKEDDDNFPSFLLPIILYGIVILFAAQAFYILTNIWSWVAVFEPKLYLAKQIIASVIN